jgi:DNA-binding winged helix-turn-helix (wHTH) protein
VPADPAILRAAIHHPLEIKADQLRQPQSALHYRWTSAITASNFLPGRNRTLVFAFRSLALTHICKADQIIFQIHYISPPLLAARLPIINSLLFANQILLTKNNFMGQSIDTCAGNSCQQLTAAGLILDSDTREVRRDGRKLSLELREFQLLEFLLQNKNRIVPREEIFREVWETAVINHTLDSRMSALRKKVDEGFRIKLLYTISRKGYLLVAPEIGDVGNG